jgi:ubiquinone/menaquinone biosynthesis C-methylase UbiE
VTDDEHRTDPTHPTTEEEHLRAVRERFDGRAAAYDDSAMHRDLAAAVAAFADLDGVDAVLDVATGTGLVLRALRARGFTGTLTGVDLSPGMIEQARRHLPDAALLVGDATRLALPDASVDLVTCVTGLQLFPHPDRAIAEWARVLRPGGRAVTATFLAFDPSRHRGAPAPGYLDHSPFDSVEHLADTVAPAGFRVPRTETWTDGADELLIAELSLDR